MTRNPANGRILIVDDQEIHIRLLRHILTEAGFTNITGFTDAREAVASFQRVAPDIVLLDLIMRPLDGFGALRQMNELMADDDIVPIIVLTADVNPEHRHRALQLGAKDFLEKPFDHDEVVLRIKNLLEMRLLHTELRDLATGRTTADDAAKALHF